MLLSDQEREIVNWYWVEHRTIGEIADLLECSYAHVRDEIQIIRRIFRSHGKELPHYNKGRPRTMPPLSSVPAA